ncbi:hypothetical protein, partial [Sphingorhabdus lacus]|uniref:hypothetical protein n=1 Tax=Sphingorhabdus lacus TaxID=392610 RepID=UPI0035943786
RNRIASLRDLSHRIPPELIAEIYLAHLRLLTSKLGKKASRNLGAIHFLTQKPALVTEVYAPPSVQHSEIITIFKVIEAIISAASNSSQKNGNRFIIDA